MISNKFFISLALFRRDEEEEEKETMQHAPADNQAKILIFDPENLNDCEEMGKALKSHQVVMCNVRRLNDGDKQRTVDILYGICFALDGQIKQIDDTVFLCTPSGVGIDKKQFEEN